MVRVCCSKRGLVGKLHHSGQWSESESVLRTQGGKSIEQKVSEINYLQFVLSRNPGTVQIISQARQTHGKILYQFEETIYLLEIFCFTEEQTYLT
jgi:hypothetical protein